MFQPSTLHTDFSRQISEDRLAATRIDRRHRRPAGRASLAARLATALTGRATVRPVPEPERPAPASARAV